MCFETHRKARNLLSIQIKIENWVSLIDFESLVFSAEDPHIERQLFYIHMCVKKPRRPMYTKLGEIPKGALLNGYLNPWRQSGVVYPLALNGRGI